jgi:hypothetical protein
VPGKVSKPAQGLRGVRARRRHWKPVAVYIGLVVLAGLGLALWDRAYEAQQAALRQPPPPPVLARVLVEEFVGSGTVENVTVDAKAGTLEMSVKDVVTKPGQTLAEKKKNLTSEGTLAIQILHSQMPGIKTITLHLVQNGKVLATAATRPGQATPGVEFSSDLQ